MCKYFFDGVSVEPEFVGVEDVDASSHHFEHDDVRGDVIALGAVGFAVLAAVVDERDVSFKDSSFLSYYLDLRTFFYWWTSLCCYFIFSIFSGEGSLSPLFSRKWIC